MEQEERGRGEREREERERERHFVEQVLARTGFLGRGESKSFPLEDFGGNQCAARAAADKWLAPAWASWRKALAA